MRINKKIKRLLYYFFVLALLCLGLFIVYVFFTHQKMYVAKILVTPEDYTIRFTQIIDPVLKNKRWYVIPSAHTAFIPKGALTKAIHKQYPEIKTVTISHKGLQTIEVDTTLRTALFRLDNGLAVDDEGVVYQEPKDISSLPLLNVKVTLPTKDKLLNISSFSNKIATTLNNVTTIEIDENGDISYFLADTRANAYVITSLKDNTETLWSTLVSAITTDPLASTLTVSKNSLLYIDLRFGNKVFYKFGKYESIASTTPESIIATTTSSYDTRILAEPNR